MPARAFPHLLEGGLVGISDRTIRDHLRLYERAAAELDGLQAAYQRTTWTAPSDLPLSPPEVQALLDAPIASLGMGVEIPPPPYGSGGLLYDCLAQLRGELLAKGITWWPGFYLGEDEFWTADQGTSVNLPWWLGRADVAGIVNAQGPRYTHEELMMVLRHEAGHAVGYAFEVWRLNGWHAVFGDFHAPYRDEYLADPGSTDYVRHLHRAGPASEAHYAQKHPDEDWAETFATWLDPASRWAEEYAEWPGALAKLEMVETLLGYNRAAANSPKNTRPGRRAPFTALPGTVGEALGQRRPGEFSPHSGVLRREPAVYAAVVLHESYFEVLRRGAGGMGPEMQALNLALGQMGPAVASAFGSWESYLTDLRAIGGSSDGWALTVWDPRERRVRNFLVEGHDRGVPAGCPVLLALDLHEHAYYADFGARRDLYLGALFRNVDWAVVERRFQEASRPQVRLPTLPQVVYAPPDADGLGKSCAGCGLFDGVADCAIHDVTVRPTDVCGYHVEGTPGPWVGKIQVRPQQPALTGLAPAPPGGTSCGTCAHFRLETIGGDPEDPAQADLGVETGRGLCGAVANLLTGEAPTVVEALGCCARWEPASPAPPATMAG
jgi:hypothetical protein